MSYNFTKYLDPKFAGYFEQDEEKPVYDEKTLLQYISVGHLDDRLFEGTSVKHGLLSEIAAYRGLRKLYCEDDFMSNQKMSLQVTYAVHRLLLREEQAIKKSIAAMLAIVTFADKLPDMEKDDRDELFRTADEQIEKCANTDESFTEQKTEE